MKPHGVCSIASTMVGGVGGGMGFQHHQVRELRHKDLKSLANTWQNKIQPYKYDSRIILLTLCPAFCL